MKATNKTMTIGLNFNERSQLEMQIYREIIQVAKILNSNFSKTVKFLSFLYINHTKTNEKIDAKRITDDYFSFLKINTFNNNDYDDLTKKYRLIRKSIFFNVKKQSNAVILIDVIKKIFSENKSTVIAPKILLSLVYYGLVVYLKQKLTDLKLEQNN